MFLSTDLDYLVIWNYLVIKDKKYLEYKFKKKEFEKEYDKKLKQSKNNNLRGETLLKLLWISKLWFNYNYNIWDKWIQLSYKNILEIVVEIKNEKEEYSNEYEYIWLKILHWWDNNKILEIVRIFMKKNKKNIFNLIKGI
jgi:hypothetical protein